MNDPDDRMLAANAMAPASQEEFDEMVKRATAIGEVVRKGKRPNENYDLPEEYYDEYCDERCF